LLVGGVSKDRRRGASLLSLVIALQFLGLVGALPF